MNSNFYHACSDPIDVHFCLERALCWSHLCDASIDVRPQVLQYTVPNLVGLITLNEERRTFILEVLALRRCRWSISRLEALQTRRCCDGHFWWIWICCRWGWQPKVWQSLRWSGQTVCAILSQLVLTQATTISINAFAGPRRGWLSARCWWFLIAPIQETISFDIVLTFDDEDGQFLLQFSSIFSK